MTTQPPAGAGDVLTINGGSSSIKFALFRSGKLPQRLIYGKVERIGLAGATLSVNDLMQKRRESRPVEALDHRSAAHVVIDWLQERNGLAFLKAVGHRVVHGMRRADSERITEELLEDLRRIQEVDLDHLPREIELIEVFRRRDGNLPQVACFDTAFHRTLPKVAQLLAIPRRFREMGVQRYGFHGLSYAFLLEELGRVAGATAARGRLILAHLGSGASLAAVLAGESIDTSMGFTPSGGLPMGSRTGDLDPGVAWYLMRTGGLTPNQFNHLINHESGLIGISGTSSDMRDLIERQSTDARAAEAVAFFCYQTRKWIGAFAAALGGVDTLVFAGGIGENAPEVRSRICDGLDFLGVELDEKLNAAQSEIISTSTGRVAVRVIRTDEEWMIATEVCRLLKLIG